jgi:hypothetical protein
LPPWPEATGRDVVTARSAWAAAPTIASAAIVVIEIAKSLIFSSNRSFRIRD